MEMRQMKKLLIIATVACLATVIFAQSQKMPSASEIKQKAEAGDAMAQAQYASMLQFGQGVEKNEAEALKWYQKSAEAGNAYAQANMGVFCQTGGGGMAKDIAKAAEWFEKAAKQGNTHAQFYLARLYENGNGVEKDIKKAVELYGKSAKGGMPMAQFVYALKLSRGEGVDRNVDEALKWAEKAVVAGEGRASELVELLKELKDSNVTGTDIVNGNGEKESGYSSAQLDGIKERLAGKVLTFENGKVSSVSKGYDGKVNVTMSFLADKSKGFFASRFMVSAKVSDEADKKWAACLDEGAEITKVTGRVTKGGMFFTIEDAKIVPAKMPEVKRMFDPETVVGQDVVNGNGVKESGYSSAQLDQAREELAGKILTFENGKVSSVSKGYDGRVDVTMSFLADKSKGFFASRFMVSAKVSDPETIKWVQNIDEGTPIKSVTGKVDKGGMFFTIVDAKIVVGE